MTQDDINKRIPRIRPHINRRGTQLYFMISERPLLSLSNDDILFYEDIDGAHCLAELEARKPGIRDRLLSWRKAGVVDFVPPFKPASGPHVVVIEPHMDDAILSAGGRLIHRQAQCAITILSVVKRSNFTSHILRNHDFLDADEITKLREQESALAASLLGATHVSLDWVDAPLRFFPANPWPHEIAERFRSDPGAFVNLMPQTVEISLLAEELHTKLRGLSPDELWLPMGLGSHVDHYMTVSACLQMLFQHRNDFANVKLSMYEDLPHSKSISHIQHLCSVFSGCGANLCRVSEDISDVFDEKVYLLSVYASQFKLSYMEPAIREAAERAAGTLGKLSEMSYTIDRIPSPILQTQLSKQWEGLARLHWQLDHLLKHRKKIRLIPLIVLPSGHLGKWGNEASFLGKLWRDEKIKMKMYAAEETIWQMQNKHVDSINLVVVPTRWFEWLKVFLREWGHFRTPTIVLWCRAYESGFKKNLFRVLLPFRSLLFAQSLSDIRCVFEEKIAKTPPRRY